MTTYRGADKICICYKSSSVYTDPQFCCCAAKSLQSCLTLCNPIEGSPPGSSFLEIFQARTLEWVAMSFSNAGKWKVKVKPLSPVPLFVTPWTAAYQSPPSMGFSRQEYWNGVPLPSPPVLLVLLKTSLLDAWSLENYSVQSPCIRKACELVVCICLETYLEVFLCKDLYQA